MAKPFFSIIIPTFSRKSFLKIAVDSVLRQTFADYEIIVVDDGSTDDTKEVINNLSNKKIRYFYQKNQGPAAARNAGIEKVKGDFICFLDSDDRFRKEKLEITHRYIQKYPAYKIFHTEEMWYRNGKLLSQKAYHKKPSGFIFHAAVKLCCVSISTAAVKREIFAKIGSFDEKLPACEDYDFWLRAASQYPVWLIPEYLTIKEGGHTGQQSKKYPALDKFRIYALEKILKTPGLKDEYYHFAYAELKRKCLIYLKGAKKRGKTKESQYYLNIIRKYQYVLCDSQNLSKI